MAFRLTGLPAAGLLLAVVAVAFAGGAATSFLYDDYRVITGDPRAQDWQAWWADVPGGIRPLLKLSFLLNWRSGLGAPGYFAVNLALHAANAVLLWRIALHLLPRIAPGHARLTTPAAWLAAILFAMHPVQAEAVTYFSGRSSPLMAVFLLSSLLLWLRWPGRPACDAAALALFVLALASRETAVVLPAAMLVVLWLSSERPPKATRLPMAMAAVVALAGAYALGAHPGYRAFFAGAFAHGDALGNLPDGARGLHYLVLRCLGLQAGSIDPVLPAGAPFWLPALLAATCALLASGLRLRRRYAWLVFGLAWFFIHLAPTYSLVPRAEPANDRHLYLAIWGPMLSLAFGLCWLASQDGMRRALAGAAVLVLVVGSAFGLHERNAILANERAVWREVVRLAPGHARGWHNLGVARHRQGQWVPARDAYCRALHLQPNERSLAALYGLARLGIPGCGTLTNTAPSA
ncbi:hypothetical protein [Arenimonas sp.]|uniref:tetratricopeptide repeat protein n=1 Tax=Arenimonas sp. TaxID=1872635 RepID=UPI0035B3718B